MNWNLRRRALEVVSMAALLFGAYSSMEAEAPQTGFQFGKVPEQVQGFQFGMSSEQLAQMVARDGGAIQTTTGEQANAAVQSAETVYDSGDVAHEFLNRNLGRGAGDTLGGAGFVTQGAGYVAEGATDGGIWFHDNVNIPVYDNVLSPVGQGVADGTVATVNALGDAASATGNFFSNMFSSDEEVTPAPEVQPETETQVQPEQPTIETPAQTPGEQANAAVQDAAQTVYDAGQAADTYLRDNLGNGLGSVGGGVAQALTGVGGLTTEGAGYVAEYTTDGVRTAANFVDNLFNGDGDNQETVAPEAVPVAETPADETVVEAPAAVVEAPTVPTAPAPAPAVAPEEDKGPSMVEEGYDATVSGLGTSYDATADFVTNDIPAGARAAYDAVVPSQETVDNVLDAITPTKEGTKKVVDAINPVNWFGSTEQTVAPEAVPVAETPADETVVEAPAAVVDASTVPTAPAPAVAPGNLWTDTQEVVGDAWDGVADFGSSAWETTTDLSQRAWETVKEPFESKTIQAEQTTRNEDGTHTVQKVAVETPSAAKRFFGGLGSGISNVYHRGMQLIGLEPNPMTVPIITPYGAFPVSMQMGEPTAAQKVGEGINAGLNRAGEFITQDVPDAARESYGAVRDFVTPEAQVQAVNVEQKAPHFNQLEAFLRAKGLSDTEIKEAVQLATVDVKGGERASTIAQEPIVTKGELKSVLAQAAEGDKETVEKVAAVRAPSIPSYSLTGKDTSGINITVKGMTGR